MCHYQPVIINRPPYERIPLADGLKWRGNGGWEFTEKMDGVWATLNIGRSIICGEQMRDGRFFAFDLPVLDGQDIHKEKRRDRLDCLNRFKLLRPASGIGGEFHESVLARGGEGVVAARWDASFFELRYKCKRVETFDLLVTEKITPCIRLATLDGEDRGWCRAAGWFNVIKAGLIVEVAAYCVTAKGKLREPRFIRIRTRHRPSLTHSPTRAWPRFFVFGITGGDWRDEGLQKVDGKRLI